MALFDDLVTTFGVFVSAFRSHRRAGRNRSSPAQQLVDVLENRTLLTPQLAVVSTPVNLDVDNNGIADALTDGVIVARYLFGFEGDSLTANAIGQGATRTDPDDIISFLGNSGRMLDADGNGQTDALTDGVLVVRYLFGFAGDALVSNALGQGATRSAAQIEAYFGDLDEPEVLHESENNRGVLNLSFGGETVHGGTEDDTLRGGSGNDTVFGEGGNDVIYGDLGDDDLRGGPGDDIFKYRLGDGNDVIDDTEGRNKLLITGVDESQVSEARVGDSNVITISDPAHSGTIEIRNFFTTAEWEIVVNPPNIVLIFADSTLR